MSTAANHLLQRVINGHNSITLPTATACSLLQRVMQEQSSVMLPPTVTDNSANQLNGTRRSEVLNLIPAQANVLELLGRHSLLGKRNSDQLSQLLGR